MGDGRRGSRGFCGTRADPGGYGKDRSEIVVGCKQSPPAAEAAIDGGDGCRNTSDESPRRSRKVVSLHTWPVCAKIAIISGVKGSPPKTALSVRGNSPPKTALAVRGTRPPKPTPGRGGSVQPASPYEVYTATKSIRSKTLRRMKVWGKPVSRSATYLCDILSAMYCKSGDERNVV